ncbi:MAG: 2-oxoacid:acceptor oxidoreductase subunit alpha, partial [Promethearchaeia archaeon]
YPMSPSTSLFQSIIQNAERLKIGGLQTEDEIAGLNMALGASHTGARSMITTSGGGFSLMVEALGLAGMAEIPIVIYNAQRPGPSTGLPTRTEQGDLLFMLHASQGEFPRIMIAPKDPLEAYQLTKNAFRLADRFQVPVMLLGDQHLAESSMNIPRIEVKDLNMNREELAENVDNPYKRFEITDDGVSPRAFPGDEGVVVTASGNSHNEFGHISEDSDNRNEMVEKRLAKISRILEQLEEPRLYGNEGAEYTLLTWGSTWGAAYEAMLRYSQKGVSINHLHYAYLYPLKTDTLRETWKHAKKVISVEQNATSQFAKLVRMETGLSVDEEINKYDGRPMTPCWIINQLKEVGVR